jgi:hypothetical protein
MIIAQSHRPTILFKKKSIYSSDKKNSNHKIFHINYKYNYQFIHDCSHALTIYNSSLEISGK